MTSVKLIPLTQGKFAIVDSDMYSKLVRHKWFYHCGYAQRNSPYVKGKRHAIHMSHQIIGKPPKGSYCDHISLDKCDNRRSNLRFATHSQSNCNKFTYKNNTTGVKGVDFRRAENKFRARIQVNKRSITLGLFDSVREAAIAYAEAAKKLHRQFARI
jgi:hypothetical protein